jgi:LysR family transcriptional regulator, chromosome initiation inhibitor
MMDLALIEAVAAVVREGSFERAARAMSLTPSAISQRVKLIEERLGTVLIVRGQPCRATEAGERLCRHAELVSLLEADLRQALPAIAQTGAAQEAATLRVAVNADSLATWFTGALARLAQRSAVLLDVVVDDQDHTAEWLQRGQVLAAVSSRTAPVQGCRSRRLGALRYRAVASPAYLSRWMPQGPSVEALQRAPSLQFDRKDGLQQRWVRRQFRREIALPAHRLPSTQAFIDAARAGIGWGLNPQALVQPFLDSGELHELLPGRVLDVPLVWQVARLPVPFLEPLTACVWGASREALQPA